MYPNTSLKTPTKNNPNFKKFNGSVEHIEKFRKHFNINIIKGDGHLRGLLHR